MSEFEEAKRIHAPVIATMRQFGYGLLLDGETFYELGYELAPHEHTKFTMNQAYAIHLAHQAALIEVLEGLKEKPCWAHDDEVSEHEIGAVTIDDKNYHGCLENIGVEHLNNKVDAELAALKGNKQ